MIGPFALAIRDSDIVAVLWICLVVGAVALWSLLDTYLVERQRTLDVMTAFGGRFVREFERPLLQPFPDPHRIRWRLRASPERKHLEILLAAGSNGRYPNLSDHRENLVYDIARIEQLLADRSFASGTPYVEGEWVVVPFEFNGSFEQAGEP
jgi:hypothetical protein